MVNRGGNFNRKYVNKRKLIRDRKKGRIQNKKKSIGYNDNELETMTKKEEKKQKRNEQILKAAGVTSEQINSLLNSRREKLRKRRQKRHNKQTNNNEMQLEKDE
jgi:hypothetical protein